MHLDLPPQEEIDKWHDKRALWQAQYHMGFWLECIPTRKTPNADVEIGHRSVSVCHLANLARKLNRKLHWDPQEGAGDRRQGSQHAGHEPAAAQGLGTAQNLDAAAAGIEVGPVRGSRNVRT